MAGSSKNNMSTIQKSSNSKPDDSMKRAYNKSFINTQTPIQGFRLNSHDSYTDDGNSLIDQDKAVNNNYEFDQ